MFVHRVLRIKQKQEVVPCFESFASIAIAKTDMGPFRAQVLLHRISSSSGPSSNMLCENSLIASNHLKMSEPIEWCDMMSFLNPQACSWNSSWPRPLSPSCWHFITCSQQLLFNLLLRGTL